MDTTAARVIINIIVENFAIIRTLTVEQALRARKFVVPPVHGFSGPFTLI